MSTNLQALLNQYQVTRTVYAFVYPETENTFDSLLGDSDSLSRSRLRSTYQDAWTQKQDTAHLSFFKTWKEWASPIVNINDSAFPYAYPTGGASEAIRAVMCEYFANNPNSRVVFFEGEYEGYAAYANAHKIPILTINRQTWKADLIKLNKGDMFFLSQPSALDGNVWNEYDAFAQELNKLGIQLMLDLTYVGAVAREFKINVEYPNIFAIFFSLSKPMGVYYHRIGGVFTRTAQLSLFGNQWFKNLLSLKLGTFLMEKFPVHYLPKKYLHYQQKAISDLNAQGLGTLKASDVVLLAHENVTETETKDIKYFIRSNQIARVCLTPRIANTVRPQNQSSVIPRNYERL